MMVSFHLFGLPTHKKKSSRRKSVLNEQKLKKLCYEAKNQVGAKF